MRVLGYSATWLTDCFLMDGCGRKVFAHTNGFGDFVLLDRLGLPWKVHPCYENRFVLGGVSKSSGMIRIRQDRLVEYSQTEIASAPPHRLLTANDIHAVDPLNSIGNGEILVAGYVQDYLERRADRLAEKMGTLGQQILHR